MEPFATVEEYEARYGEVEDAERVTTLLGDASAFVADYPGLRLLAPEDAGYELQRANLTRTACAVVHRSLSAGDLAGLSSYSQGGVGYTASVSVANPTEDFYLTASERRALGIRGGAVSSIRPAIHDRAGEAIW
ncbi:hypothetical protein B5G20_04955 [Collinsella sp. An7]|uniref:hypothetical protein n=1 Tax=Collinsella sp. An7 TaxID=1965651 RepID=UPI000B3900B9|nr:hypothetical protein [Collinsella sp. An7]OUN47317.1 hypothetical protein B5G20_04955 [Collinsella sp. An7]